MIPGTLQHKLLHDVSQSNHLCALVDMAQLDNDQRVEINDLFKDRLYPLIVDDEFKELADLSATLIAPKANGLEEQGTLIEELDAYNSDVISAWITSPLQTSELAEHFRQATFAYDEQGGRYLLRYYDPLITPILYGNAPADWQQWFFAPITSWWFAHANAENEKWHQIVGYRKTTVEKSCQLIIKDSLWNLLVQDNHPHVLLESLEKHAPQLFTDQCRGVRLAQVKSLLQQAKGYGLESQRNLNEFVYLAAQYSVPALIHHPNWQSALAQVKQGDAKLTELIQFK